MPVGLVAIATEAQNFLDNPIQRRILIVAVNEAHSIAVVAHPLIRENLFYAHEFTLLKSTRRSIQWLSGRLWKMLHRILRYSQ